MKQAALQGTYVINNPFWCSADDKFFNYALATKLGVASPRTLVLPNKDYVPGINHQESLRNLKYPLDWDAVVQYIGMPCILKDAHGGGWKHVYKCDTKQELFDAYDRTSPYCMTSGPPCSASMMA